MNVLIIPEDFRKDQYILKPIIKAMLAALGKPRATVNVCQKPLLGGVAEAMKWERLAQIIKLYPKVELFLLLVDRDGKEGRRSGLDTLEQKAAELLPAGRYFVAENAWQEIEVWVLTGHDLPKEWKWKEIRAELDPKELYFEALAEKRGLLSQLGEGRKTLAEEAAKQYKRIRQLCDEVAALEDNIRRCIS